MNPNTRNHVISLAVFLASQGARMRASDLVQNLNLNKLPTGYGTPYDPNGRGVFRMLTTLYAWLAKQGRQSEADAVATVFTKQDGTYAWQ
jgi:hypothetical protein